ncbi:MAG: DUF3267 domain-containing protein [Spirochaetia bacterium]|nr:DUF3267 domain-containing protein [Spirochaetia bacterium]
MFNLLSIIIAFSIFLNFRIISCPPFSISSIIFIVIGLFIFIIVHELIHGLFIKIFSGKKANYKFSFFYASAGASDRYFDKTSYIIIALSPVIIITTFLMILINLTPSSLYNGILLVLALNISGAIGDFYISAIVLTQDNDILIRDNGESMHFYTKTTQ